MASIHPLLDRHHRYTFFLTIGEDYSVNIYDVRFDSNPILSMNGKHGGTIHSVFFVIN